MRRIDTHMHFWTLAMERSYSLWMTPELKVLYRDYGPRDARPLMKANGDDQQKVWASNAERFYGL
jgi:L-fuconolactonase